MATQVMKKTESETKADEVDVSPRKANPLSLDHFDRTAGWDGSFGGSPVMGWRVVTIVLPKEFAWIKSGDNFLKLRPSNFFNNIQRGPYALRRRDWLYVEGFDASWGLDARVGFADSVGRVELMPMRPYTYPEIERKLYRDDLHFVSEEQGGFVVYQTNGARVSGPHDTHAAAVNWIMSQHPKKV